MKTAHKSSKLLESRILFSSPSTSKIPGMKNLFFLVVLKPTALHIPISTPEVAKLEIMKQAKENLQSKGPV